MKTLLISFLIALGIAVTLYAMPVTCFKSGEEMGRNVRYCYYNCNGDRYTTTVPKYKLCPLQIRVNQ